MIRPLASGSQKYTAFGLHGPALGLDLSVYGLGLVHAGLRRYIFRDPSARGRIISHFSVRIHGVAAMISFINILRAATLYNERTTYSLLFVMVSFPFLLFTILSRIIALSVISCFLEYQWTLLLFLG